MAKCVGVKEIKQHIVPLFRRRFAANASSKVAGIVIFFMDWFVVYTHLFSPKTVNEQFELDFTFSRPLKWAWSLRLQDTSPFVCRKSFRSDQLVSGKKGKPSRKFMSGRCLSRGNKNICGAFPNLCSDINTSSQMRLKATSDLLVFIRKERGKKIIVGGWEEWVRLRAQTHFQSLPFLTISQPL